MKAIEELQEKLIQGFLKKKDDLIEARLTELGIQKPEKCRFNPLLREQHEGFGELYYYNDGTKNGLFIIGFKDIPFNLDTYSKLEMKIEQEYFTDEPNWNKIK